MVDSPEYPCQLVFVTKLTAVLNEESGETFANCWGLNGSHNCTRCSRYSASAPSALNRTSAAAYVFQPICAAGSMPHSR